MALSGIPKVVHRVFHEQMKKDFNRVINDFIKLFNPNENYVIRNCKPYSMLNLLDQQVIFNTHFAMNSCLREPTGYMRIEGNNYVIE